jgi:hypothetical protein
MDRVQYLGYIVDAHGVHVDPAKIQVIHDWPTPTMLTELQSFLGLANFYRRFMLGFSHIAWALSQVTRGGGKEKFVWGLSQQKVFDDLKQRLCSAPVLSLPDLQQPFEIETDASDYVVGTVLTQHDHPWPIIVRHYQMFIVSTLLTTKKCTPLCKPSTSGGITFSGRRQSSTLIISHCSSCRHKENCRMTCHQKWSTYLQQFHLNIKYKIGSTNRVIDFLSRPPVVTLTTVLDSCGHETSRWPHLYETDPDFANTYQMLGANTTVTNFHLQGWVVVPSGHLCVPSSERVKMIWESHYSRVAGHFSMEKIVAVLQ